MYLLCRGASLLPSTAFTPRAATAVRRHVEMKRCSREDLYIAFTGLSRLNAC